jgi:hypothetical protein
MMKRIGNILTQLILLLAVVSCASGPGHMARCDVTFYATGNEPFSRGSDRHWMEFHFAVTNVCTDNLPDLRPAHLREHSVLLIDGNPTPFFHSGADSVRNSTVIETGQSEATSVGVLVEALKEIFGDTFTVQWEFCGARSKVLTVDLNTKTVSPEQ